LRLASIDGGRPAPSVVTRYRATDTSADVTLDRPDEGLRVRTDPDDLDRIMTNLLDNATEHGRPPITIRAYPGDAATVTIEVRDHGDGIEIERNSDSPVTLGNRTSGLDRI
jgi:signal transduction histidine kinase